MKAIITASIATMALGGIIMAMKKSAIQGGGKYFTIAELCRSATASAKGIDNTPTAEIKANLQQLIDKVLDPVRSRYGKPIIVTSGYRCPALEAVVSGAVSSQHMTGCAADLQPTTGGSLADIFRACVAINNYDQLIIEENERGARWVHVSYSPTNRRGMILAYKGGKYIRINSDWENWI